MYQQLQVSIVHNFEVMSSRYNIDIIVFKFFLRGKEIININITTPDYNKNGTG